MSSRDLYVIVAPDSFKGTIDARRAAEAIADGWRSVRPGDRIDVSPMADGGEGTVDAFAAATSGARRMPVTVTGPDDARVLSNWLLCPPSADAARGTGIVELANTSGIEILGESRHPMTAHTRGFGQAIAAALDHGVSRLVLGIGSSASTDMGFGVLRELGARFTDSQGQDVPNGVPGVKQAAHADLSQLRPPPADSVVVLTDVTNPLTGAHGAARVFGPQKGMSEQLAQETDAAMAKSARLLPADPHTPGAGAAGGVGFALLAWGANIVSGATAISTLTGLAENIPHADFVVTGEGSFDGQSAAGKAPFIVAELARASHVPIGLVAGRVSPSPLLDDYRAVLSLTDLAGSTDAALASPSEWLQIAGRQLASRCP